MTTESRELKGVRQILKHDPTDIDPELPMSETSFGIWLQEENWQGGRLSEALVAYYGLSSKEQLHGQFQGDIKYNDSQTGACKSMGIYEQFKYTFENFCQCVRVPPVFKDAKTIDDFVDLSTWHQGCVKTGEQRPRREIYVRVNGLVPEYMDDMYHYFSTGYAEVTEQVQQYMKETSIYGDRMSDHYLEIHADPPESPGQPWLASVWLRYQSISGQRPLGRDVQIQDSTIASWREPIEKETEQVSSGFEAVSLKDAPKAAVVAEDKVRSVLHKLQWEDGCCKISEQLSPKDYKKVDKVLQACGGKWNKKAKHHKFEGDGEGLVRMAVEQGWYLPPVDYDKLLQWFETPEDLVDRVVGWLDIEEGMMCLEPSAGEGAIALGMRNKFGQVQCYELDKGRVKVLDTKMFSVEQCDFLKQPADAIYDCVGMNPPFSKQQDVKHVLHAFEFLKPGGVLVAIMSRGWTFYSNKLSKQFREFVDKHATHREEVPAGAFAESGTQVPTIILRLQKPG